MKRFNICLVGCGSFGARFVPIFQAHPCVKELAVADLETNRTKAFAEKFGIRTVFDSLETALESDFDAIAIFTQRHLHGPMAIAALNAGKHVYCSVPMATKPEEIKEICRLTGESGLTYMMGETTYYGPACIWCRERFRQGAFGEFVYGEGEYLHDMSHGFYEAFQNSGGENWKRVAGVPPMFYPTHSVSGVLGVTGARVTRVACLGRTDNHEDGIFRKGANLWDNTFSNQTALGRTSDGGMIRFNEFRRIGVGTGNSVRQSIFGTMGAFEMQCDGNHVWTDHQRKVECLNEILDCYGNSWDESTLEKLSAQTGTQADFFSGYAQIHPVDRLPSALRSLNCNGHYGSHQFLVDDFCKAVAFDLLPPVHAWTAARFTLPGLIAHRSAMAEGEFLEVPDYGDPPVEALFLEMQADEILVP